MKAIQTTRRQARFHCAFCGSSFADHQAHVNLTTGEGRLRKAHLACAESWLRRGGGMFSTRRIPIIDGRER